MGKHDKEEPVSGIQGANELRGRVNDLIQRISKPETLIDHLQRIGTTYWIAPAGMDQAGQPIMGEHLVIPWSELMDKEYQHIKSLTQNRRSARPNRSSGGMNFLKAVGEFSKALQEMQESRNNEGENSP